MSKSKTTIDPSAYKYGVLKVRGKDGRLHYSSGNGDAVHRAVLLHVAAGGTMKQIIEANGLDIKHTNTNTGLVRMSVGGALRAMIRSGNTVKIGKLSVHKLNQKVELPKVELKQPDAKAKPRRKRGTGTARAVA